MTLTASVRDMRSGVIRANGALSAMPALATTP
ncbi:hypothetical protein RB2654_15075 [Rhodobacterales bacterium HTCC2654]|uniref:Uncharacterized protein n=1 Tax=Maritimibacter alkaliphilus HTCC2654 TaxID=314271 RepID=A3VH64_9RHOB|nr:hypothetical protein RB2654_15075 [Rhodobacterales bacterium HTCC2654] [Maritimibacter alkaliphilus HTCC2654]